mmetsp:Transcript_13726/g.28232  ORF Transcript_13726/g.28232 Transcript_13726/m.28232 type:complete len:386 (+) Transcript_13726:249-1406(+)
MASLHESQAFLDQFDKCLPLCEKGDAVTVINALHTLNTITQGSIAQARELDPASGTDFVCSFLIELELALELYISPSRKLGTIDGGLPTLYSFREEEISSLVEVPSPQTKRKVRKFLDALGVEPSSEFESRGVRSIVRDFLKCQVKPSLSAVPPPPSFSKTSRRSISWADQCSSGNDSDSDSLPSLAEEDEGLDGHETEVVEREVGGGLEEETEEADECVEEEVCERCEEDVAIFLWASPSKAAFHDDAAHRDKPTHACDDAAGAGSDARKKKSGRNDPFFKTRMCKNWEQAGACPFGERCNFAHGAADLRSPDAAVLLMAAAAKPAPRRDPEQAEGEAQRRRGEGSTYKTRMCKNIETAGVCKYGDRCVFAHSHEELRQHRKPA